ncbi:MAG: hypothetical protein QOE54_3571 [Streptosporangiaceae bacterium]|nr:hypothetical protein [Streptosporangiaceae bacterium]
MRRCDTFGGPTTAMYLAHMPIVVAVAPRHVVTLTAATYGVSTS